MEPSEICRRMEKKNTISFPPGCTLEQFKEVLRKRWGSKRSNKMEPWMWEEMYEDLYLNLYTEEG